MFELSIKVSDDDSHYTQKFLVYNEGITLSNTDPELSRMVNETIQNFNGTPEEVILKIRYSW